MKDQLRLIFELNQMDLKMDEIREFLEGIPARREKEEGEIRERKTVLEERSTRLAEIEKLRREKEGEVELSESRLKEFQGKLSQIKTNKEYQAALKEIAETKKTDKTIEDQILELMTKADSLKQEKKEFEEALAAKLASYEEEKGKLEAEEKRFLGLVRELEDERKKHLASIDPKVLALYQKIKRVRRDAVAFVDRGACQGCNMNVPPQLYIEIQKLKAVHACPSCHRILYLQEWQEGERKAKEASS